MSGDATLLLRLAGPLQSWGSASQFNRRDTSSVPSKSGVIGLLAAAQGRRRGEDITDLVGLRLGVRVEAPGSVLRDYHTVSDYRGKPLPAAGVLGSGAQKLSGKDTHVTQRFYLQDAVFLAALEGPLGLLGGLADAVMRPSFPLALGRRCCVPTQPVLVRPDTGADERVWPLTVEELLGRMSWQVSDRIRGHRFDRATRPPVVTLATTIEADAVESGAGDHPAEVVQDVPISFAPARRGFRTRRVRHGWVTVPSGFANPTDTERDHDPFSLLGW